ncbi:histidine phosphotransferase family protein [Roseivivax sp. CAU 1761]
MSDPNGDLSALVGSRICHDLISPIGAIANGLELLAMAGMGGGPELALIEESCRNAAARIRFYRVAFGAASADQPMAQGDIAGILADFQQGGRLQIDWRPDGALPRAEVQLAFLLYLCMEAALPRGGRVGFAHDGVWHCFVENPGLRIDAALWHRLDPARFSAPAEAGELAPAQVQFRLLRDLADAAGRGIRVEAEGDRLEIRL